MPEASFETRPHSRTQFVTALLVWSSAGQDTLLAYAMMISSGLYLPGIHNVPRTRGLHGHGTDD